MYHLYNDNICIYSGNGESKGLISEGTEDSLSNHPETVNDACKQALQSLGK